MTRLLSPTIAPTTSTSRMSFLMPDWTLLLQHAHESSLLLKECEDFKQHSRAVMCKSRLFLESVDIYTREGYDLCARI